MGATGRDRRGAAITAGWLACCLALLAGSGGSDDLLLRPVRVLQMNLCNSGFAGCYSGRAVDRSAEVFRSVVPDVVTLNEVCEEDLPVLRLALADVRGSGQVVAAFRAAGDRVTGGPYRCRNEQPYGIGLVVWLPRTYHGHSTDSGLYPDQDLRDPEQRAWLCLRAGGHFSACTTHLADTVPAVALAQCRHLVGSVLPRMRAPDGGQPAVVGADLNLIQGGDPDLRSCLPPDYPHTDDGGTHVLVTPGSTVRSLRFVGMSGTTDHPSMLVTVSLM